MNCKTDENKNTFQTWKACHLEDNFQRQAAQLQIITLPCQLRSLLNFNKTCNFKGSVPSSVSDQVFLI